MPHITYHKLTELFLVDFFCYKCYKNGHFWSCPISYFLSFEYPVYLEISLLNFCFGFDIDKTIPVYIPTHLVISIT